MEMEGKERLVFKDNTILHWIYIKLIIINIKNISEKCLQISPIYRISILINLLHNQMQMIQNPKTYEKY